MTSAPRSTGHSLSSLTCTLRAPLDTAWSTQPVHLWLKKNLPGEALELHLDGTPCAFQFTGKSCEKRGAEVALLLGFERGQSRTLAWTPVDRSSTDLSRIELPLTHDTQIGPAATAVKIAAPLATQNGQRVAGPFAQFASFPLRSSIFCDQPFESASLARTNAGPLFEEFYLRYQFAQRRSYSLSFRFWKHEPMVEVAERFSLGMNAALEWWLNPDRVLDTICSRDSFEGESQPTLEPLAMERVRDVLCRLQMPVLSEYFVPNNRGWFSLFDSRNEARGALGVIGLYGGTWREPVANMPELYVDGGSARWAASLASGSRAFLLHAGAVEKQFTPQRRFVFHRLHAEFSACRLDEHLDLTGEHFFDESGKDVSGMFADADPHAAARERVSAIPALRRSAELATQADADRSRPHRPAFDALLDPTPANKARAYDAMLQRFQRWVRQFQGYRTGENDYMKNTIGFSRWLRGMLISYELMRKQNWLSDQQVKLLNDYFVFAARRITDAGRWAHARTAIHPDHPESLRDFYTYGGEHKPDRLYWTNSLPNFQSDPLCALAQLSAIFIDHPDAPAWRKLALDDLESQLNAYCGKSGAWEESINYALYTLSYFVITFRVLQRKLGIDYFNDPRVRSMVQWLVDFFGPFDKRFGVATWPGVGNAGLPQVQGEYLLAFAVGLSPDDPLRAQCIAVYQRCESHVVLAEHYPLVIAALAPIAPAPVALGPVQSTHMDELGVSMRHEGRSLRESYLFQKIGFAKDHYEADETAFNWYAKGTPLCMDYGTYTGDVAVGAAHNLVEVPDQDPLRRGYLKAHHFTPLADFTHSECPVTLKLLWGRVRSFEEVANDGKTHRNKTPYYYIGDKNPLGPKVWKVRLLLFVKPDYVAIFDRVYGDVPHRYNLHVTGNQVTCNGSLVSANGRFDLDLACLVQHPRRFDFEAGTLEPACSTQYDPDARKKHAQDYFRLYNREDGLYRTLLFAREKSRDVKLAPIGAHGMQVVTADYTDLVFLHDDCIAEETTAPQSAGPVRFNGRSGWIRKSADGSVSAMMIDGDLIEAFGVSIRGRGPWTFNHDRRSTVSLLSGPPRRVEVR